MWDIQTGELIQVLDRHSEQVNFSTYSPDGKSFITASDDLTAKIWNGKNGDILHSLDGSLRLNIFFTAFNPDGKNIVTLSPDSTAKIWSSTTGELLHTLIGHKGPIITAAYSPDGKNIVTASWDYTAMIWDSKNGDLLHTLKRHINKISLALFSSDGETVVTASDDGDVKVWDCNTAGLMFSLEGHTDNILSIHISADGKKITTASMDHSARIWDSQNGKLIYDFEGFDNPINHAEIDPDGNTAILVSLNGETQIMDIRTGKLMYTLDDPGVFTATYSPDGESVLTASIDRTAKIWDAKNGTLIKTLRGHEEGVTSAIYSSDGQYIITISIDETAKIWESKNGKLLHSLGRNTDYNYSAVNSMDGKRIITYNSDGSIKIWETNSGDLLVQIIELNNGGWLNLTKENYYYGNPKATSELYWIVDDENVYTFEQFDLKYNRPDIILSRLGYADSSMVNSYYMAYQKRLKKMGFKEEDLNSEFHIPVSVIEDFEYIPVVEKDEVDLNLQFKDSEYKLDRYNIWINDVPVLGTRGKSLRVLATDSFSITETIALSRGKNKIQVSCLNEKGAESYKETVEITYDQEDTLKPDLYFLAISVSAYKQDNMNLVYAVKDGRDMVNQILSDTEQWEEVYVDTLFDQEARRENILPLKEKLLKSNIDDQVVLFVSGHGLLDENFEFYFATHDIDFNNPSERGVSYDELEWLLDSIPARKKLFLMDACHSGEVDKERLIAVNAKKKIGKSGVKEYTYRVGSLDYDQFEGLGLQNSFELMQELFTNLNRGSGTVVISAAAGNSYAMESDVWQNGVFTYSILKGLQTMEADINNDGEVTVSELRDFVSESVQDLTGGLQKPTMRQENVEFDFRVW